MMLWKPWGNSRTDKADHEPDTVEIRIGVDLGSNTEPTGITVIECEVRNRETEMRHAGINYPDNYPLEKHNVRGELYYVIRHVERIDAGTKYPDIFQRVRELYQSVVSRFDEDEMSVHVYIECAGNLPAGIECRNYVGRYYATVVQITTGDTWEHDEKERTMILSKNALVGRLNMILQYGALELPTNSPYTTGVVTDIENYTPTNDLVGSIAYGDSAKTGPNNDLVVSLGVGCFVHCGNPNASDENKYGGQTYL